MAASFGIPGLGVALIDGDRQATVVHGVVNSVAPRPVGSDTWFQAASAGKHVTACVVLELAAQGRIDLAAPIGTILKDAPHAWAGRSVASLLRHTSGLPEYLAHEPGTPVPVTRAAFFERYGSIAPLAEEGARWSYSNTNYILLGFLVATVTGRSCGMAIRDLFARTGVRGAMVASPAWVRDASDDTLDHEARDEDSLARELIGDGDVAFTATGATGWLRVLLGERLAPPVRAELFAPATLATGSIPYGCGLFVERLRDATFAHHAGHFDGWTAALLLNVERRSGVLALCNLAPGSTHAIRAIAQAALEGFAPGSTPLSLAPIPDTVPAFTAMVRHQMLREFRPADPACFAPSFGAADVSSPRGVVNLWAGRAPDGFDLVGEEPRPGTGAMRRYRLRYPDRTEHVSVGMTADGLIDWAWPC